MNPLVKRDIPCVTWDNGSAPKGAAPVSASNTPEGLTTDCVGVEMAKAKDTHTPSTAEPPALLESCPSCLARNHAPALTERIDAQTIVGHYLCVLCGETWETSYWTGASA